MNKLIHYLVLIVALVACNSEQSLQKFYVDPNYGSDNNKGTIEEPFQSLQHALNVVDQRIGKGILSDHIYLRGGVYKKQSARTLYELNLKGSPNNYAVLSAMPCEPGTPGSVERKSGQWYEKVVFDDSWVINTKWKRIDNSSEIWVTNPGYTHLEWGNIKLWPWLTCVSFTKDDETPETTSFTVAPFMLLQDKQPTFWVDSLHLLTEPGYRYYDQTSHLLYFRPFEDKNPNTCTIETWYGGPEDYEEGTLYLDGEGRGLFDGNLKFAAIRGFEFRMFNKIFEFQRRHYEKEADRRIQQDVLFEDNYFEYGWMHILLDANSVIEELPGVIRPRYEDRARWTVKNNIFYRPSREVFQIHGDDHVFEHNIIIDHLGPWAGPAACVSAVNTRNTRNMKIRYNYILGQGNNSWHTGSVFMIESGSEHADENGDYIFGGQTYEYNLIADVSGGFAFVLGKGGVRLQNISVRNNIFKTNQSTPAIRIGSPHKNLDISNNIFYDQTQIIEIADKKDVLNFGSMPNSIRFSNNILVKNKKLFDSKFINPDKVNEILLKNNTGWENRDDDYPFDVNLTGLSQFFVNPDQYNFTLDEKVLSQLKSSIGPYISGFELSDSLKWWRVTERYPNLVPIIIDEDKK